MKRTAVALILLFVGAFIIDSFLAEEGSVAARYLSKGLLMPLLLAWFFVATKSYIDNTSGRYRFYIAFALLFSWVGDIFLIGPGSLNFVCGIGAFLIAQVFYVLFFFRVKPLHKSNIVFAATVAVIILAYLITLNILLWQKVNEQQFIVPVFAYSIVLGLMLFASFNTCNAKQLHNNIASRFIAGAIIFVLSDSMIALNSFYLTKPLPGFYIMLTYCVAQFFIVSGAVKFIKTHSSN
jgi:uncharacterized membrane protein YhhN